MRQEMYRRIRKVLVTVAVCAAEEEVAQRGERGLDVVQPTGVVRGVEPACHAFCDGTTLR